MPAKPHFSTEDRAHFVLATMAQWIPCRLKNGRTVWAIPSQTQPGVYYLCDGSRCECPGFARIVAYSGSAPACKHMLAVQLHRRTELQAAEALEQFDSPHLGREMLVETVYRPAAQEILNGAGLTRRQRNAKKYADIWGTDQ